jgi:hypothetical protein
MAAMRDNVTHAEHAAHAATHGADDTGTGRGGPSPTHGHGNSSSSSSSSSSSGGGGGGGAHEAAPVRVLVPVPTFASTAKAPLAEAQAGPERPSPSAPALRALAERLAESYNRLCRIDDLLYIGNASVAGSRALLQEHGIQVIVNGTLHPRTATRARPALSDPPFPPILRG